ncbi:MAG: Ig-like domain-containing protein, partial [Lachnospiraceae bacterium]|nr:Ig-like domain-containing protein [Lachnospiraceae bacterium]
MKKSIFKIFSLITVFALILGVFSPIGFSKVEAAKKVKINKKSMTLETGEWQKLKLKNGNFAIEDITWTTSDKAVAKVSKKGWVVGLVKGQCTITATVNASGK